MYTTTRSHDSGKKSWIKIVTCSSIILKNHFLLPYSLKALETGHWTSLLWKRLSLHFSSKLRKGWFYFGFCQNTSIWMNYLIVLLGSLHNKQGIACTATEDDVDVFMSGYAFRLKILHERGLSLVKKQGNWFFSWPFTTNHIVLQAAINIWTFNTILNRNELSICRRCSNEACSVFGQKDFSSWSTF